jgi:hypothetical protein
VGYIASSRLFIIFITIRAQKMPGSWDDMKVSPGLRSL